MKKFERIKSYNKKYSEELNKSIKLILPTIIEAFVSVYGKKHRDYISYTIKNIKFIYFISEKILKVASNYEENLSNHEKYIIKYYLSYFRQIDFISYSVQDIDLYKFVYNKFIVKTDINFEDLLLNNLLLYDDPIFTFAFLDDIKEIIKLPIYTIDLKTIMHEINHALCIDAMAIKENEIISPNLFNNIETEEIINDYIADLALKEYIKLGGIIPKELRRINIINRYEYNYFTIEYLFDNISPLILEALITKRFNLLHFFIDKENFIILNNLIQDLYNNGYEESKYLYLIKLIDKIYRDVINKEVINNDEYLYSLEQKGYNLKLINKK